METIKTAKITKTTEVTETTKIYRDTISNVEIEHDGTICLTGTRTHAFSLYDINLSLAHCNDDIRMLIHHRFLNAHKLNLFLKGAIIDVQYTNICFGEYNYTRTSTRIINAKLSEKAIKMIHNMLNHYISIELGY